MPEAKRSSRTAATTATPGAEPALHEVFLSPRVIDREAFNDFSTSLRRLIEEAADRGEALRNAAEQAAGTHQQLRDLATRHTAKFEAAARAVTAIDERTARAEQLIVAAQQAAEALADLRGTADRIVADHAAAFDRRVESAIAGLEERLKRMGDEADARAAESRARADLAQQQLEAFTSSVETQLSAARQTLSGYEARAVRSIEDAAVGARRSFDGVCEALSGHGEELRMSLAAAADTHRERIEQFSETALSRSREASRAVVSAADIAESRVAALAQRAQAQGEERQQHLADMLARAEEAAGEIEALVGLPTPLPDEGDDAACQEAAGLALPGSLADMVLKTRVQRGRTEEAATHLESASRRAEETRAAFARTLGEARDRIESLESRVGDVRRAADEGLAACEQAARSLADRRATIEALAKAPMADLERHNELAATRIAQLDERAAQAQGAADLVVDRTQTVIRGLSNLLTQLRPWQALLIDADPSAPMPPALRTIIDQVRAEIAGDMAAIATGLQQVAQRAQRAAPEDGREHPERH